MMKKHVKGNTRKMIIGKKTSKNEIKDSWTFEIIKYPPDSFNVNSALFDFDGTISLIREGWQEIMIPYFTEILMATPNAESESEIRGIVTEFVDTLTGKQTIFQCIQLGEEVVKRGGQKCNPFDYKKEYLRRLDEKIKHRINALATKTADPLEYLVPGSIDLFNELQVNGIKLYLASGTDEENVLKEARLLGVDKYFSGGIYGAKDDVMDCSKELVIHKILKDNNITGEQLISFGDGYVEIELVANIGGYTFGVATDEVRKSGINTWKRDRLVSAGAAAVIPDFTNAKEIIDFIKRFS